MKLLEHEAKTLLSGSGIAVPASSLIRPHETPSIALPYVLKSQVLAGKRGKAGGIIVVEDETKFHDEATRIFSLPINNLLPETILVEEKLSIKRELYLSMTVDRSVTAVVLMAHIKGGVEVEDNQDFKVWKLPYSNFSAGAIGQELADYYDLPGQTFALQDLLEKLSLCFIKNDATLIEINPLILTTNDTIIAGDCKITLDDAAKFRHEWNFVDTPAEANFVTIDPNGEVATIANGAGLAMATVDAVYDSGMKPANFLDIGGGANAQTLMAAFSKLVEYPHLKVIVINIFAGITRADEVAKAIIEAKKSIASLPPLFIRLAGTNQAVAAELLVAENIPILPNLEACLQSARKVIHG